jgi:threonine dehydratase
MLAYVEAHPDVREFVYASPRTGYAQFALALACRDMGRRAIIFVPDAPKNGLHALSQEAQATEHCTVIAKTIANFNNLHSHAKTYCREHGAHLVKFGGDDTIVQQAITAAARTIQPPPEEVWTAMSSGVLSRSLQQAWPHAEFKGVTIGHSTTEAQAGRADRIKHKKQFHEPCGKRKLPPFPSSETYDAKVWDVMKCDVQKRKRAKTGVLFWNVGA